MGIAFFPVVLFAVLMAFEELARRKNAPAIEWRRTATNWGLGLTNWLIAAIVPVSALLASAFSGSGMIDQWSLALAVPVLVIVRSLGNYGLHRLAHHWAPLWAVHKLHHSDRQIDITTGLRNHPVEALLAAALAAGVTILLGASAGQVILADAILFSAVIWHHAAIRLPSGWSERLEIFMVTPRFHRLHHSVDPADYNRNFGDLFSLWDRAFGSFNAPSRRSVTVGLGPTETIRSAPQTGQ